MADIVPALAGGIFGTVGGLVAGWFKARADRLAWERSRRDAVALQSVALIRDFATTVASGVHSMCWLCWKAKYQPEAVTAETVRSYDTEMHELLPKALGAFAGLVGTSPNSVARLPMPAVQALSMAPTSDTSQQASNSISAKWRSG